jgi:hypothetical protein
MNRKREKLQAYFAGIFDGEGTVGIYNAGDVGKCRSKSVHAHVSIQMDNPTAIGLIYREYPEALFTTGMSKTGKKYWRVVFNGTHAYRFLDEIKSYTIVKHNQVIVCLTFLSNHRKMKAGYMARQEYQKRAISLQNKIRLLKVPNTNAVITVNSLLDHELRQYRSEPEDVQKDVSILSATVAQLQEALETRLRLSTDNKTISSAEKDIVHSD